VSALETGDRAAFTARLRSRLAGGVPDNVAHPLAPGSAEIPVIESRLLDPSDIIGSFVRNASHVRAAVHDIAGAVVPDDVLGDIVARHDVSRAVISRDDEAVEIGQRLTSMGVEVATVSATASARADLGVTAAAAGLAATGTLVQDSHRSGGRTASLLPRVHLCVLPASRIVPSTAAVLRPLGDGRELPSNLALITGPSRSGDIELVMAFGVHGPVAVEIALLRGA
jgi:L-lactate dehydrogenase complex protein LldG